MPGDDRSASKDFKDFESEHLSQRLNVAWRGHEALRYLNNLMRTHFVNQLRVAMTASHCESWHHLSELVASRCLPPRRTASAATREEWRPGDGFHILES